MLKNPLPLSNQTFRQKILERFAVEAYVGTHYTDTRLVLKIRLNLIFFIAHFRLLRFSLSPLSPTKLRVEQVSATAVSSTLLVQVCFSSPE